MADFELDETDLEILESLDRTGEIDADALAERLDVSSSTVYYRVEQYREHGLLKGAVADLDAHALGFELTAITEIKCDYGPGYEGIAERISQISGVQNVYFMLGEMSFVVISKVRDHEHLQRLIDDVIHTEGVEDSSTHMVLTEFKNEPRLLVNYEDVDLDGLIQD
jgi:Lrp/AsnC family leucine-responsive transcriptional regulator